MRKTRGFTLVELMVAIAIGLVLLAGIATVFIAQRQVYSTASAQASIQNAENAIAAMVTPALRSAGFAGCGAFNSPSNQSVITGTTGLPYNFSAPIQGYDATASLTTLDAPPDTQASDWSPSLDSSLVGLPEKGSDVIAMAGTLPGTIPVSTTTGPGSSGQLAIAALPYPNGTPNAIPQHSIAVVSNCAKASFFITFSLSSDSNNLIVHVSSSSTSNKQAGFTTQFPVGSQFSLIQQVVYYVGRGPSGQSALYAAAMMNNQWQSLCVLFGTCPSTSNGNKSSVALPQPLVPGVDNMQILYGVGPNGVTQQWVPASSVTSWNQVNAVRMGYLIEGPVGSANYGSNPTVWNVLGTTVTVPRDTRLRHVYVMTTSIRNATL